MQADKQSRWIGGGVALLFHLLLLLFFVVTGIRTIYPIPQDEGILIEYLQEEPRLIEPIAIPNEEPRTPIPNPDREIRLVQQAVQTEVVQSQVRSQESTLGETGDVDIHEPPPPKPINQRALFKSRDTGDSLAEQSSRVADNLMKAGNPDGNTLQGNPDGTPSAALPGRSILGALPRPDYNKANTGGTVIVRILVDQYGNVTRAQVSMAGTTVQDKTLWDAATKAALKAKFNLSNSAPVVQEGTITYLFTLK